MVSISLYKGNLHKVPDVPRKWLMPTRQISVKDFKALLRRRSRALSRLPNPNPSPNPNPTATDLATNNNNDANRGIEDAIDNGGADERGIPPQLDDRKGKDGREEENVGGEGAGGGAQLEGGDGLGKMEVDLSDSAAVEAKRKDDRPVENELNVVEEGGKGVKEEKERAGEDAGNPNAQVIFFSFSSVKAFIASV